MKNEDKKQQKPTNKKAFRLRINYRTIVTVRSEAALKAWLERYPDAVVLK